MALCLLLLLLRLLPFLPLLRCVLLLLLLLRLHAATSSAQRRGSVLVATGMRAQRCQRLLQAVGVLTATRVVQPCS